MFETIGKFTNLGYSFGNLDCLGVPLDSLDKFYEKNQVNFTESCHKALLRALGIPATFFEGQPKTLKSDIFESQRTKLIDAISDKEGTNDMLFLRDSEGVFQYAGMCNKGIVAAEVVDPVTFLKKIGVEENWDFVETPDYDRGYFTYTYYYLRGKGEFTACVSVLMSIFHTKPCMVALGMGNGLSMERVVDKIHGGHALIRPRDFSVDNVAMLVNSMVEMAGTYALPYKEVYEFFKYESTDFKSAKEFVMGFMTGEAKVPKSLVNKCLRQLALIEAQKEVDEGSPNQLSSTSDVFDIMCHFTSGLRSTVGRFNTRALIFEKFYDLTPVATRKLNFTAISRKVNKDVESFTTTESDDTDL